MAYIKRRGPVFALILSFFTFGIYTIYWLFSFGRELAEVKEEKYNPGMWLIISVFTLGAGFIYMYYKTATMASDFAETDKKWLYFILLMFIGPVGIYMIQSSVNEKASAVGLVGPGLDFLEAIGFFVLDTWKILAVVMVLLVFVVVLL